MFYLTEIMQCHTFSAFWEVSLDYRSDIQNILQSTLHKRLSGADADMVCTLSSSIILCKKLRVIYSDYPKGSRVPDLYRKARPTYLSYFTELV